MGVLAGGANWVYYGPSLVPLLPQPPVGAQHPPAPLNATALVELDKRTVLIIKLIYDQIETHNLSLLCKSVQH